MDSDLVKCSGSLDDGFNFERDGPQFTVEDIITVSALSKLLFATQSSLQSKTLFRVLQSVASSAGLIPLSETRSAFLVLLAKHLECVVRRTV